MSDLCLDSSSLLWYIFSKAIETDPNLIGAKVRSSDISLGGDGRVGTEKSTEAKMAAALLRKQRNKGREISSLTKGRKASHASSSFPLADCCIEPDIESDSTYTFF